MALYSYLVEETFTHDGVLYEKDDYVHLPDCPQLEVPILAEDGTPLVDVDNNPLTKFVCAPLRIVVDRPCTYIVLNKDGFTWQGRRYVRGEKICLDPANGLPDGIELAMDLPEPSSEAIAHALGGIDVVSASFE